MVVRRVLSWEDCPEQCSLSIWRVRRTWRRAATTTCGRTMYVVLPLEDSNCRTYCAVRPQGTRREWRGNRRRWCWRSARSDCNEHHRQERPSDARRVPQARGAVPSGYRRGAAAASGGCVAARRRRNTSRARSRADPKSDPLRRASPLENSPVQTSIVGTTKCYAGASSAS